MAKANYMLPVIEIFLVAILQVPVTSLVRAVGIEPTAQVRTAPRLDVGNFLTLGPIATEILTFSACQLLRV